MQPSSSGLLVIWANFPQTTFPPAVTRPSSETLTSMIVPLVMTPSCWERERDGISQRLRGETPGGTRANAPCTSAIAGSS